MNANDHAILIGISRYPELEQGGKPADLQGPGNDVDAIMAWLLDPKGGGFPNADTIHSLKSGPATSAADARPTADELEATLSILDGIAQQNREAGRGLRVGRRIYIFMSGHGFSPGRQRGCLFAANAKDRLSFNVHATGWLSWLQDSGYFREFVLWMDCCMNRLSFLQPRDPPLPPINAAEPPRANFVAFAAQRPLKAVETAIPEDGGRVHGVFTWTLLEGLRGAAADVNGRVTGRSLADWIRNAQFGRLSQRDIDDADVAKEPEVIQEDAGLIFARGVSKPSYDIRATFPAAAVGATARIWGGAPTRIVNSFTLTASGATLSLPPGLYLIDVPDSGLRQGFEVVKPGELVVEEQGPPVVEPQPGQVFELAIDPDDPTAEIYVIDSQFSLADGCPAQLSTPLPFGLFKIKTRIGRTTTQRVILLDRDRPPLAPQTIVQAPATIVPILGTRASHEYHSDGKRDAVHAANALGASADQAVLMVMARAYSGEDAPVPDTRPWEGLIVVDAKGRTVLDLAKGVRYESGGDPYAYDVKTVDPGAYYLRQRTSDGTTLEQSLIASKSWRIEVYILRRVLPGDTGLATRPRVSIMMRRLGDGIGSEDEDRTIEAARLALADERRVLNAQLEALLLEKFNNPIAGIIGGHLLLVERERDPGRDISKLDKLVIHLTELLGPGHPDVAALALQSGVPGLGKAGRLVGPPMFQRSWKFLVQAAGDRPGLVPVSLWDRVRAMTALPPLLAWSADEEVKSAATSALATAILGARPAEPAPAALGTAAGAGGARAVPMAAPRAASAGGPVPVKPGSRAAKERAARLNAPPSALKRLSGKNR
jgi:hypothetical protein